MELAGANFAALDAFAGTSYNLGGRAAYNYYAAGKPSMRTRALQYGKPFIFIETGTFAMMGKETEGDPRRAKIVAALRKDFGLIVRDPTVMGVLYFNAFGDNTGMLYHVLYDPELVAISQDATCTGGGYVPVGVGVSTGVQAWQAAAAPACTVSSWGCPFVAASACGPSTCIDDDGDGLVGDGGGCTRTDCDDSDPAIGPSCDGGADEQMAEWGTLRVVDANVPAPKAWSVIGKGIDTLPVIGYQSGPQYQGDVTLLKCTTADCSTALKRVVEVGNNVGGGLSMQIRSDGRPFLSYHNATDFYLETFDCADVDCTSGYTNVEDINVGQNGSDGFDSSVTMLPGDVPSMAYWAATTRDLAVITCPGGDCSWETVQTLIQVVESSGSTGFGPSAFTGPMPDGFPYVVYSRNEVTSKQVKLLRCTNTQCSTRSKTTLVSSNALSLPTTGVALRADSSPLVLYRNLSGAPVEAAALYSCPDATCSTPGTSIDIYTASGVIENGSVVILPDGKPFIALSDRTGDDYDLVLIYCHDAVCSSSSVSKVTDGSVGEHPGVMIRSDGNPLVVYHDVLHGRLMVYDVAMSLVAGTPQVPGVPTPTPLPTDPPTDDPPTPTEVPWAAPVLSKPAHNVLLRATPKFSWGGVKGALIYQFQYNDTLDFDSPQFDTGTTNTRTYILPPTMPKGIYFWRVRAGDGVKWTEWSAPRELQIAPPLPGKLSLLLPANGAKVPGGVISLSWKPAIGAASYEIQFDIVKLFSNPTVLYSPGPALTTDPLPVGTYYWRVRGLNEDDEPGPWSAYRIVVVP
jgi:hypothetical protein